MYIKSNFAFLPKSITNFQKQGLSLNRSLSIVENAQLRLIQIRGEQEEYIKIKIKAVLEKNEGYQIMKKIS